MQSRTVPEFQDGERRLAAVAFTDIVGYSALVHRDDANAMRLVGEHFALVREIAARFGGKVIKTIGDSVHLEFASAQAATAGAIAIQQAHRQRNARVAAAQQFEIRIGVHLGDVEQRDGDIYGDGVNIAARLQPLAPVGGIAISDHVRGQLRSELRNRFSSRGTPTLKNIETPIELFVLEGDDLAGLETEAPAPETAQRPAPRSAARRPVWIVAALLLAVPLLGLAIALVPHLRSTGAVAPTLGKSIAVLPFVDMSPNKDQEYFSDGISEDLLNLLSKIETLQVAARTSSFSFKGKDVEIPEIARRLRVANVLEGSVRKAGNQVRITARLVRAADGYEIWSQTWDRAMDDVFKIQDEIAGAVVSQLRVRLLGTEPTVKAVDPRVYPLILQAQALGNQGSPEADTQSIAVYEQALALDPHETRAWAGLARVYSNRVIYNGATGEDAIRAMEAANKALESDPGNATALGMRGRIAGYLEHDRPSAARYYQRALEIEPGNLQSISGASILFLEADRMDEALALMEYRVAHDPANPIAYHNLGLAQYYAGRWKAAVETSRTALRLSPDFTQTHTQIGCALLLGLDDAAGALKEFEAEPEEASRLQGLTMAYHALGRTQESDAALKELTAKYGQGAPTYVAMVHAYRREPEAAFRWLEKATVAADLGATEALVQPIFDPLHGDPRWLAFLRRMGLAPEQLAGIELKVTLPASASSGT